MDSKRHFLISLAIGIAVIALVDASTLTNAPIPDLAVVGYAAVLGVAIDFDHFLVSRLHCGDWRAAKRCLDDPKIVFFDQEAIFDVDDLWGHQRLLSHVVIVGLFVPGVYVVAGSFLAVVSAVVLYAHVLADLVEDNRKHEQYLRKAARVAESEDGEKREVEVPVR